MSRVAARAPSVVGALALSTLAALALSACGSPKVAAVTVVGVPSTSISVPLQTVACTTSGACVAVGTWNAAVPPTSVGEVLAGDGRWSALAVPEATSSLISTASCWKTQCVFAGSQPGGDLLWLFNAMNSSMTPSPSPGGAQGVDAVSCFAELQCAAVDTGPNRVPRLLFTPDGGSKWTAPQPVAWASGDVVTGLACSDRANCLVSGVGSNQVARLYATHDGGSTWSERTVPSNWHSLKSLTCQRLHCVGLVTTAIGSKFASTSTFGREWSTTPLRAGANALACASHWKCVAVGQLVSTPWLSLVRPGSVVSATLQYVPSPLLSVACGAKVCAAIGVTTVLALRP